MFAPFTFKTAVFVVVVAGAFIGLPRVTPHLFKLFAGCLSAIRGEAPGCSACWGWCPGDMGGQRGGVAAISSTTLAGSVGRDHALIRRLRTIVIGLLTPFYFIRAGYFVSIAAVVLAPIGVVILLLVEVATKVVSVYPVAKAFGSPHKDAMYTTLIMASGLTFGTIASLFGLSHKIIDESQYSTLVAAIIATAIIPTVIANSYFSPRHLLPKDAVDVAAAAEAETPPLAAANQ